MEDYELECIRLNKLHEVLNTATAIAFGVLVTALFSMLCAVIILK
jgi:hypothetical protein